MFLCLWVAAAVAQVILLALRLRSDDLPWFTAWILATVISQATGFAFRNHGLLYDSFWRMSAIVLVLLLMATTGEVSRKLSTASWWEFIAAVVLAAIIHLSLSARASGPLQVIFSMVSFAQLVSGLFLIQAVALSFPSAPYRGHASVLTVYMLAAATCYYSAAKFPMTIGNAVTGVDMTAAAVWIWQERKKNP